MSAILVTGGSGTFGRAFVRHLIRFDMADRIVVFSRDEQKQEEMAREIADPNKRVRYMLGDVRDFPRLFMAMHGINTVVHAAALKIVPKCEYDPIEAVRTNVGGAENVIRASIAAGVSKVIGLSTDKAVAPVNLYGATKLTAERLFIAANHLSGSPGNPKSTRFSVVRYGNVANSRGSVIPLFKKLFSEGKSLPITHSEMTRFWITIDRAIAFVFQCLGNMMGGEVFIPRMPSFRIIDLAAAISANPSGQYPSVDIGMRPGEKIHETLITLHDTPMLVDDVGRDRFMIMPEWSPIAKRQLTDFTYSSDTNTEWLSVDDLRELVK